MHKLTQVGLVLCHDTARTSESPTKVRLLKSAHSLTKGQPLMYTGWGTRSHFVYIHSDVPLKPLPLKDTIVRKKYIPKREYNLKRDNML